MSKAPKRLVGPSQVPSATGTRYTVPAATKTILRHIHIQNPSGGAVTFTMSIGADAANVRLYDAYSIGAGAALDVWCYHVLETTEVIADNAGTNNVLVRTYNGDEITLG